MPYEAIGCMTFLVDRGEVGSTPSSTAFTRTIRPDFDFLDFEEAGRLVNAADGEWRTIASHLVMRGGTMTAVQELLGHSTIVDDDALRPSRTGGGTGDRPPP